MRADQDARYREGISSLPRAIRDCTECRLSIRERARKLPPQLRPGGKGSAAGRDVGWVASRPGPRLAYPFRGRLAWLSLLDPRRKSRTPNPSDVVSCGARYRNEQLCRSPFQPLPHKQSTVAAHSPQYALILASGLCSRCLGQMCDRNKTTSLFWLSISRRFELGRLMSRRFSRKARDNKVVPREHVTQCAVAAGPQHPRYERYFVTL